MYAGHLGLAIYAAQSSCEMSADYGPPGNFHFVKVSVEASTQKVGFEYKRRYAPAGLNL